MKSKPFLTLLSILALIAAVAIPFFVKGPAETVNQTLNISASLISATFSVLTFIIAILLFQRFGIDNILLQKRTDVVFQLLEKINNTNYFIEGQSSFRLNLGSAEKKNIEHSYPQQLAFTIDYYDDLDALFTIADSPFMPRGIVEKMEVLRNPIISFDIPDSDKTRYSVIYLVGQYKKDQIYGRLNSADITLYEFVNHYIEIKEAIVLWIVNNTSLSVSDLNI